MPKKQRMIGIKIRDDSDLDKRLKKVGYELRLSHAELLDKWLTMEEEAIKKSGQLNLGFEQAAQTAAADNQPRIEKLERQIAVIMTALELRRWEGESLDHANETGIYETEPEDEEQESSEPVAAPATEPEVEEPEEVQIPEEEPRSAANEAEATVKYIMELSAAGLTTRKIAERLQEEERPVLPGMRTWNHVKVARILKESKAQ